MSKALGEYRAIKSEIQDSVFATTQKWRAGSRYEGRSGYRSLMDQASHNKKAIEYDEKYGGTGTGARGVYSLMVRTPDGKAPAPMANINIGGKMFKADKDGNLRILDKAYLDEEIQAFQALKEYEESVVVSVLVSDEMARHVLGDTAYDQLGAGSGPTAMSPTLKAIDARPSVIRYYDPTSKDYAQAVAKVRAIVHDAGIIVNTDS